MTFNSFIFISPIKVELFYCLAKGGKQKTKVVLSSSTKIEVWVIFRLWDVIKDSDQNPWHSCQMKKGKKKKNLILLPVSFISAPVNDKTTRTDFLEIINYEQEKRGHTHSRYYSIVMLILKLIKFNSIFKYKIFN